MAQCVYTSERHHSSDLLAVFHGRIEPTYICGFHEMSKGIPARLTSLRTGNE